MTFLPHNVPQSIILIRLDVTSSFRKRLVSTNESSETKFPFVSHGDRQRRSTKKLNDAIVPFDSLMCFCYEILGFVVHSIDPISVA